MRAQAATTGCRRQKIGLALCACSSLSYVSSRSDTPTHHQPCRHLAIARPLATVRLQGTAVCDGTRLRELLYAHQTEKATAKCQNLVLPPNGSRSFVGGVGHHFGSSSLLTLAMLASSICSECRSQSCVASSAVLVQENGNISAGTCVARSDASQIS